MESVMVIKSRAGLLALAVSLVGCNAIFGLDEPRLGESSGTAAGAQGPGGSGGETPGGGGNGAGPAGGMGGTGGGEIPCDEQCDQGCFEDVCGGHVPIKLAPGEQISCVVVQSGAVYCSGSNAFGGLAITPTTDAPSLCATGIGAAFDRPCSHEMVRIPLPGKAGTVATGQHAACAVLSDGRLFCWGSNGNGQLGHAPGTQGDVTCLGGAPCQPVPFEVTAEGLDYVTGVWMTSWNHTCAIDSEGDLVCWGLNTWGQVGDGSNGTFVPPTVVQIGTTGLAALGEGATCYLDDETDIYCAGENAFGQFGMANAETDACDAGAPCETTPRLTPLNAASLQFATPRSSLCAIVGGSVQCLGWNGFGIQGTPDTSLSYATPQVIPTLDGAVSIHAGDYHACALRQSQIFCWGTTFLGQLGDDEVGVIPGGKCAYGLPCNHLPQKAIGIENAVLLGVGTNATMALRATGEVVAWGISQGGNLGHDPADPDDPTNPNLEDKDCQYSTGGAQRCASTPTFVHGLPEPD